MEYHLYLIDFNGNPHFLHQATDYKHANDCCDHYFDELWTYGEIRINGTCYLRDYVVDIYMVRADIDPYKGVIER